MVFFFFWYAIYLCMYVLLAYFVIRIILQNFLDKAGGSRNVELGNFIIHKTNLKTIYIKNKIINTANLHTNIKIKT